MGHIRGLVPDLESVGIQKNFEPVYEFSKEKAKDIIAVIKESKLKVQAQIQDDQVRVIGKNRDDLQDAIQLLKGKDLEVEMQFTNFRE